jgi:putative transposase
MPIDKKKHTTASKSDAATSSIPEAELLSLENFHQYLRAEIRQATRMVMEEIMREELSQFLGAEWGESTGNAKAIAMASTAVI